MRRLLLLGWLTASVSKWHTIVPFLEAANKPGSHGVMLDVGANDGGSTLSVMKGLCKWSFANLCCSKKAPPPVSSLTFITFEPQPKFRSNLVDLHAASGLCDTHKYEFYPAAAWSETTNLSFVERRDSRASLLEAVKVSRKHGDRMTQVPTLDLASFINKKLNWTDLNFLKFDVEVAEYSLLPNLLTRGALCPFDYFFVEWHLLFVNESQRLEAVALRLAFDSLIEKGCPPRPRGRRVFEHDETENNKLVKVPGLTERARWQNGHGYMPTAPKSGDSKA
ncbi:hypothetical protein AB1Y20_002287 [Prymnesium parvum]|uniref:Methyltransferase FkbM domain-containing protein n=1 Tax=Prymnesium parvum TaxID=97485 RepID=A0AB34JBA0_PRYPA